ncbi:hypothetical protein [Stenotrophomonas maltophilia]|uniref:hypothetical protein n=1 Tax=Stenotrophomonas maltophilia group TaxID=995085 RepID=UPI001E32A7E6|nr:hypothetical protein [Stenotrophomonas maltophilia]
MQIGIGLFDNGPRIEWRLGTLAITQHDIPHISRQRLAHRGGSPTLDDGGQIMQGLHACDGTHGSGIIAICEGGRRYNHPKREERWKHTVPERLRHDDHRSGEPSTVHSRHEGGYEESFKFPRRFCHESNT